MDNFYLTKIACLMLCTVSSTPSQWNDDVYVTWARRASQRPVFRSNNEQEPIRDQCHGMRSADSFKLVYYGDKPVDVK